MIQFFRVNNYRAIGREQSINFLATSDKSHLENINNETKILSVTPIYGGNATGKTNLLKGIKTLQEVVTGNRNISESYEPCKFINENGSSFEIVFFKNKIKYYYKLKYNLEEVLEEFLYYYPKGKISKIFHRENQSYDFGQGFKGKLGQFSNSLSKDSCFLRVINEFISEEFEALNNIKLFFNNDLIFLGEGLNKHSLKERKKFFKENKNKQIDKFINEFYKHLNIGTQGFRVKNSIINSDFLSSLNQENKKLLIEKAFGINIIEKTGSDDEFLLKLLANKNNSDIEINLIYNINGKEILIPIEEESEGIQNIFKLGSFMSDALSNGKIVLFDELESGFHTLLAKKIIEIFIKNKENSQLIFTTHNTALLDLDIFRRDQIYFTKRNKETDFTSSYFSLSDIKGIRKSTDIEKAYLKGAYCDSPRFNKFNSRFSEEEGSDE